MAKVDNIVFAVAEYSDAHGLSIGQNVEVVGGVETLGDSQWGR